MPLVSELELPAFDYTDPSLRGERFHYAMRELSEQGWLASMPLGCIAVDREAGEFFLRSRAFTFPGMKIAEIFGIDDGPLWEEIRRNILHINGADHSRLRGLVNPAFTPRAIERWRPAMRGFLEELFAPLHGRCDAVEALAKPYPSMMITTLMGAPLEGPRAAVGLVALDPAPVRHERARGARADRARRRRVLRVRGRAARAPPQGPRRRPDLDPDRRPARAKR